MLTGVNSLTRLLQQVPLFLCPTFDMKQAIRLSFKFFFARTFRYVMLSWDYLAEGANVHSCLCRACPMIILGRQLFSSNRMS